ncbi:MAG: Hsp33 family molecular chaperone HslO [Woeseiaceae bacterium]|nr:Hsp33 family molecular chaperone HslO [Woeseiaceae bacterium]
MSDQIVPFVFENLPVRGSVIQLERSWQRMIGEHDYAPVVVETLGQAAAATGLIAHSLKFDGSVTMQIQSSGELRMLVMQCTSELEMRGMAVTSDTHEAQTFAGLLEKAHCAITVDNGERPYQGIVEVSPESLVASLENYFGRSVQVPSLLALFADGSKAGGLLLQQMPGQTGLSDDDWARLGFILDTLTFEEMTDDEPMHLIGKLFAEDDVRVYGPRPVAFHCPCSRTRAEEVLKMLGEDDAVDAVETQGVIRVTCEYCGRERGFDAVDVSKLFADNVVAGSKSVQ